MEKDVDEVGKLARSVKAKLEELDREVRKLVAVFFLQFSVIGISTFTFCGPRI